MIIWHILGILNDDELSKLCKKVIFPHCGVVQNIHPKLISIKNKKNKKKIKKSSSSSPSFWKVDPVNNYPGNNNHK